MQTVAVDAHSDDRPRAVLRATRDALQRVSSDSRPDRPRASRRSCHVPVPPELADARAPPAQAVEGRTSLGLGASTPLAVYTGTFEQYQGLDLLFEATALVAARRPDARLLMVGGSAEDVAGARERARAAGVDGVAIFAG